MYVSSCGLCSAENSPSKVARNAPLILEFENQDVTETEIKTAVKLPFSPKAQGIKRFAKFHSCRIFPGAVRSLLAECEHPFVGISFTNCHVKPEVLGELSATSGLEELNIKHDNLKDEDLSVLKQLASLRRLRLDGTRINGDCLGWIPNKSRLEKLSVADTAFDDKHVKLLSEFKNLSCLDIDGTQVSGKAFFENNWFPGLEELYAPIKSDTEYWLVTYSRLRNLRAIGNVPNTLVLTNGRITRDLSCLMKSDVNCIWEIRLHSCEVGQAAFAMFSRLRDLERLDLSKCSLTGEELGPLKGLTALRTICLDDNPLTKRGIAMIGTMSALKELSLNGCLIAGHERQLSELRGAHLEALSLGWDKLSRSDFRYIASLEGLEKLSLQDNEMKQWMIRELRRCHRLRTLNLNGTKGLNHNTVHELIQMKQLDKLLLHDSDLSVSDREQLKNQLKYCEIVF